MLAESWEASDDVKEWRFKIRKGVTFHDGKELTPDDVVATLKRHSDPNSKSGALGVLGDIADMKVDGDNVVITLKNANADLPLLLADYHLVIQPNGGMDDPNAGIGTGPYKVEENEPGVRHLVDQVRELLARRRRLRRFDRDPGDERHDGAHVGAAVRPGPHDQPRRAEDGGAAAERARRGDRARALARATTSSSCTATRRPSTTTTCAWR